MNKRQPIPKPDDLIGTHASGADPETLCANWQQGCNAVTTGPQNDRLIYCSDCREEERNQFVNQHIGLPPEISDNEKRLRYLAREYVETLEEFRKKYMTPPEIPIHKERREIEHKLVAAHDAWLTERTNAKVREAGLHVDEFRRCIHRERSESFHMSQRERTMDRRMKGF